MADTDDINAVRPCCVDNDMRAMGMNAGFRSQSGPDTPHVRLFGQKLKGLLEVRAVVSRLVPAKMLHAEFQDISQIDFCRPTQPPRHSHCPVLPRFR